MAPEDEVPLPNANLTSAPKRTKGKALRKKVELFHWKDLPEYLRDNEFIVKHYRADTGLWGSVRSLFRLHNETGNVWTHLLGLLFFIYLLVGIVNSPPVPMAMRPDDAESLWQVVSCRLDRKHSSVMQQLHALQAIMSEHMDPSYALKLFSGPRTRTLNQAVNESMHSLEHNAQLLSSALAQQMQVLSHAFAHPSEAVGNISAGLPHNMSSALEYLTHTFYPAQPDPMAQNASTAELQQRAVRLWQQSEAGQLYIGEHESGAAAHFSTTTDAPVAMKEWLRDLVQRSVMWPAPRWPFYLFMSGAMACLFCSAFCHLLACCNKHVSVVVWRFDYAGITANIVSSFYPSVYYVFMCTPIPCVIYLATISVLGVATLLLSTLNRFQHSKWRPTRAICFAILGLCGVFPWGHVLLVYKHIEPVWNAMIFDILMGASYLGAAVIFTLRVPEKWYPGRFDLVLHSHQIFHVFVVVGCYLHYMASMELVRWRDANGGCALELTQSAAVQQAVDDSEALIDLDGLVDLFQCKLRVLWQEHRANAALRDALLLDGIDVGDVGQCLWADAPR